LPQDYTLQMAERHFRPNETFTEYFNDKIRLIRLAFPAATEQNKILYLSAGMPEDQKQRIREHKHTFTNVEDVLEQAKEYKATASDANREIAAQKEEIKALSKQIEQLVKIVSESKDKQPEVNAVYERSNRGRGGYRGNFNGNFNGNFGGPSSANFGGQGFNKNQNYGQGRGFYQGQNFGRGKGQFRNGPRGRGNFSSRQQPESSRPSSNQIYPCAYCLQPKHEMQNCPIRFEALKQPKN